MLILESREFFMIPYLYIVTWKNQPEIETGSASSVYTDLLIHNAWFFQNASPSSHFIALATFYRSPLLILL